MTDKHARELIRLTKRNTLYTGSGTLLALLALLIAITALLK